ncbi:MAG: hypothetical protein OEM96_03605, partial [Gemmatimonadota bacterium]|nr:hypothetical protein [Gemmatimonadota bacterium]
MPSSTSSSSVDKGPIRPIPTTPWARTFGLMALLLVMLIGGWELYWRDRGFVPSINNTPGLWAQTRRRVDAREPRATVFVGSSRTLFDIDLQVWQEETGVLPIQLALEGSNPLPVITSLAEDEDFAGLLIVGVTPPLVMMPDIGYRADAFERYKSETPSQWMGHKLSVPLERLFAFYHFDTRLFTVLHRQAWPAREGREFEAREVRRLSDMDEHREADLWVKIDDDPEYAKLVTDIWKEFIESAPPPPPEDVAREMFENALANLHRDVEAIRARGGEVVFIRLPSVGWFREFEAQAVPREQVW